MTPDARSTAVFSRGIENGLIALIPVGGQEHPISGVGASLLWKKAQKKAKKNITSEVMNRMTPNRSPEATRVVWCPMKVASRITSRHHCSMVRLIIVSPRYRQEVPYPWNQEVRPMVRARAPTEPVSGQGLNSTRWNGWRII